MLVGAAIFFGHGNHDGISTVSHSLLALLFLVAGVLTLIEGWAGPTLRRYRQAAVATTGTWLALIGWVLFQSGWEPNGMISAGWVWVLFCWNALAVGVVFALIAALAPTTARGE